MTDETPMPHEMEIENIDVPEFLKTAIKNEPIAPGNGLTKDEQEALRSNISAMSQPDMTTSVKYATKDNEDLGLPILAELPRHVATNVGRHAYLAKLFELHALLHAKMMELSTAGEEDIIDAACLLDQAVGIVVANVQNRHAS